MDSLGFVTDGVYDYKGKIFEHDIHLTPLTIVNPRYLRFFKCVFKKSLNVHDLKQEKISISFSDCIFEDEVSIQNCNFHDLKFYGLQSVKDIFIEHIRVNEFKLSSKHLIQADFYMHECTIRHIFDCSRLEKFTGKFVADINRLTEEGFESLRTSFRRSNIKDLQLHGQLGAVDFEHAIIVNKAFFSDVILHKSYFNNADFGSETRFNNCEFISTVSFKDCIGNSTEISFEICTFKEHAFFTEANFSHLSFTDTTFESRVSFVGLCVNTIRLHLVTFSKTAFFDDVLIRKIIDSNSLKKESKTDAKKWRYTLRQIKQELQKAENRIDYNRFRAYEMQAYYQELDWKWNGGFKNKLILWATKWVTGFDHSWRRALFFSLTAALTFYSLFFIFENSTKEFDFSGTPQFITGYFRFLIVTDFYNPLSNGREYIANDGVNHIFSWLIFIFGKIVIASGIYEMIQAFRKFKA